MLHDLKGGSTQNLSHEQKHLAVSWLQNNLGLLVLLLVSFLVYIPGLSGDFVIDDIPAIRDNPYIRDASHIARFFTKSVWENTALEADTVSIYRPMNLVPLMLNYKLWGNNPAGYHFYLLLLHLANTCLVYAVIRKLVACSATAATVGAAVFALHPTRVESVAWICGGVDPLAAFFLLGAFLAHMLFVGKSGNKEGLPYLALSLLCFQLALWSKEVAIVFPLIAVAHDLLYKRKINWTVVVLQTAIVAVYLIVRSLVLGSMGKTEAISLSQFSRAIDFVLGYGELLVFPVQVPFYLQPPEHAVSSILGVAGMMVIALLAGFSWRTFNPARKKTLVFSAIWMAGFFWPAILLAFYADGYYAARHLYIPMAGAAVFASAFYDHVNTNHSRLKIPFRASCVLLLIFYGLATLKEIPLWHDNAAIYGEIARVAPESAGGFNGLGHFYLQRKDYAAAEKNFVLALQKAKTSQDRVSALVTLGTIQGMNNNLSLSERYLREALQADPQNSEAWAGLGNLAWMQGQIYEAISCYEKAISMRPGNYEAATNLAMAYEKTGQFDRAALIRQKAAAIRR